MKKETKNLCKYLLEDKRKLDKTAFFIVIKNIHIKNYIL